MATMDRASPARTTGWKNEYLLLALIVAIGAGLRFARSGYDVLSFDEQWHLELSTGRGSIHMTLPPDQLIEQAPPTSTLKGAPPWYAVWTSLGEAVHPPLYFVSLRIWQEVFGEGEQAARTLSILFSLGTIVLISEIGRRTIGPLPALGASLLFAIAPNQVYLAQQVRGYAMVQCLGVGAMLAVLLMETANRPRASHFILLGATTLAMMLTHYFAIGGAVAIGLYVLIRLRGRVRWQSIGALGAATIVYAIIWLPQARPQLQWASDANSWLLDDRGWIARASTLVRLATAPWREVVSDTPNFQSRHGGIESLPACVGGALFVAPLWFLRRNRGMLLAYLWMCGAIGFVFMLDLTRSTTHLRFTRYLALGAPGVFLTAVAMLTLIPRWLGKPMFIALAIGAVVLTPHIYQMEEGDWRRIGTILNEHAREGEAVVVYRGTVEREAFAGYYYLAAATYSHQFPRPLLKLSKPATAELVRQLPGESAWLITTPKEPPPPDLLPGVTALEQFNVPGLVTCYRVELPAH